MMKATKKDKAIVLSLLSASFNDNASVSYAIGSGPGREVRLRRLMNYAFDCCLDFGAVYLSSDRHCCALVMFPDRKRNNLASFFRNLRLIFGAIGLSRLLKVWGRELRLRKRIYFDHIFYLWFIGVEPGWQGKGRGTAMIQFLTWEAGRMSRPMFLETSVARNLDWYERLGFERYDELDLGFLLVFFRKFF